MARWLRFANTLGALELLAADVCAAAAARPHFAWRPTICPDSGPSLPLRSAAAVSTNRRHCRRALRQCGRAPSAQLGLDTASYRRGNSAQRLGEFRMTAHNGVDPPRSKPVFTPIRATTSLHVPSHTHLTTMGQELNRLAPSSCCRHRRPMGVRGRRAPTAQPSRVGKALPLFFGGTVASYVEFIP